MKKGDFATMVQHFHFQHVQLENPSFFYAMQLDKDDLITNKFWASPRMMMDYSWIRIIHLLYLCG